MRVYPQGRLAGHIIGYTGKTGRNPDGIIDNHEVLWPETRRPRRSGANVQLDAHRQARASTR